MNEVGDEIENLSRKKKSKSKIPLFVKESKAALYTEAIEVTRLWGEDADNFIRDLIETGSIEKTAEKHKDKLMSILQPSADLNEGNKIEAPCIMEWQEFVFYAVQCFREQKTNEAKTMTFVIYLDVWHWKA